jgi:hypothetical protein
VSDDVRKKIDDGLGTAGNTIVGAPEMVWNANS